MFCNDFIIHNVHWHFFWISKIEISSYKHIYPTLFFLFDTSTYETVTLQQENRSLFYIYFKNSRENAKVQYILYMKQFNKELFFRIKFNKDFLSVKLATKMLEIFWHDFIVWVFHKGWTLIVDFDFLDTAGKGLYILVSIRFSFWNI